MAAPQEARFFIMGRGAHGHPTFVDNTRFPTLTDAVVHGGKLKAAAASALTKERAGEDLPPFERDRANAFRFGWEVVEVRFIEKRNDSTGEWSHHAPAESDPVQEAERMRRAEYAHTCNRIAQEVRKVAKRGDKAAEKRLLEQLVDQTLTGALALTVLAFTNNENAFALTEGSNEKPCTLTCRYGDGDASGFVMTLAREALIADIQDELAELDASGSRNP